MSKELAEKVEDILMETPRQIHQHIENGDNAKAFQTLTDYARDVVIEELERLLEIESLRYDGSDDFIVVSDNIWDRIKELKQDESDR